MAWFGTGSYAQRLEHRNEQPLYHSDDVCGSTFSGLASTLERFAVSNEVGAGMAQIRKCIEARKEVLLRRRDGGNAAHHQAITMLEQLQRNYMLLGGYGEDTLRTTLVRFKEPPMRFEITINGGRIMGGGFTSKNKRHSVKNRRTSRKQKSRAH